MKTKVYLAIVIRLILLFGVGMLVSLATPYMREFFGDVLQPKNNEAVDPFYNWGARHYWYFWLMICLFLLLLINFIISVINIIRKNYDVNNW